MDGVLGPAAPAGGAPAATTMAEPVMPTADRRPTPPRTNLWRRVLPDPLPGNCPATARNPSAISASRRRSGPTRIAGTICVGLFRCNEGDYVRVSSQILMPALARGAPGDDPA